MDLHYLKEEFVVTWSEKHRAYNRGIYRLQNEGELKTFVLFCSDF